MKFQLTNGQELEVGISHGYFDVAYGDFYTREDAENNWNGNLLRSTRVRLLEPQSGVSFEGLSVCKPPDNFCRREGRRRAAMSLLRNLKSWGKEVRRSVFQAVCPEYK